MTTDIVITTTDMTITTTTERPAGDTGTPGPAGLPRRQAAHAPTPPRSENNPEWAPHGLRKPAETLA
jgi:hypothetical protein